MLENIFSDVFLQYQGLGSRQQHFFSSFEGNSGTLLCIFINFIKFIYKRKKSIAPAKLRKFMQKNYVKLFIPRLEG
jgi:hypothetical protein